MFKCAASIKCFVDLFQGYFLITSSHMIAFLFCSVDAINQDFSLRGLLFLHRAMPLKQKVSHKWAQCIFWSNYKLEANDWVFSEIAFLSLMGVVRTWFFDEFLPHLDPVATLFSKSCQFSQTITSRMTHI